MKISRIQNRIIWFRKKILKIQVKQMRPVRNYKKKIQKSNHSNICEFVPQGMFLSKKPVMAGPLNF